MLPNAISIQLQKRAYESLFRNLQENRAHSPAHNKSTGDGGVENVKMLARRSEFDQLIADTAQKYELEESLLKAVVQAESNFDASAVSHAGAKGLMQLMDQTANKLGVRNVFHPDENIEGGARYLNQLLNRYSGNEQLALAAYNAGHEAVDLWRGIPPYEETKTYVPRVLNLREQYRTWMG